MNARYSDRLIQSMPPLRADLRLAASRSSAIAWQSIAAGVAQKFVPETQQS
jgi:hypothetical protein